VGCKRRVLPRCCKRKTVVCKKKKKICCAVKKTIPICVKPTVCVTPTPIHVDPTPVNVDPTPVHVDPTPIYINPVLSINPVPFRRTCTTTNSYYFQNTTSILLSDSSRLGSPYPSTILATGMPGTITKVTVTLEQIDYPLSVLLDILLVGPDGIVNTFIMSDAGDDNSLSDTTLNFDDDAANFLPENDPITTGTYKPTNYQFIGNLPAPAPPTSQSVALSNFNGRPPNGLWRLFVSQGFRNGQIAAWALTITTTETEECLYTPV